ncbi:hypothetical protein [Oceanibaculum pacificum]|uniref:Uncharacterized protein n=1 Tax=Oceanibaculum pacificum TaxID=580166 RepID=A0A154VQ34_9PROT|nr:hypothetical protein [Oceanibaculum pacificum]KZD03348.1 hypothetical protein AUP43_13140 [Oceanibaculum pacificum]
MRMYNQPSDPKIVQHFAKEFARFLNRVQDSGNDMLGSFLVEQEWDRYANDANDVVKSLEIAGFVVTPRELTDLMIAQADQQPGANKLMGQRGARMYITAVMGAMANAWNHSRDVDLIVNILSMALARASAPSMRRDMVDSSYRRFAKTAMEIINDLERAGYYIMPDEATPIMINAGVAETAERATTNVKAIGADPEYVRKLYQNVVAARPDDCRPRKE